MDDAPDLDLDRVLAEEFLDGLEDLPLPQLRDRKAACDRVEGALSYLRRLVQGRLDIVRAELHRRSEGHGGGLSALVEELPQVLAGSVRGAGAGRLPATMAPEGNLRLLTADLDRIIDADKMGALHERDDAELEAAAAALAELERRVSDRRRSVHERLDALHAELVRRYRSGEATVDALLR